MKNEKKESPRAKPRRGPVAPTKENIDIVRRECGVFDFPIDKIMDRLSANYSSALILRHEARKAGPLK